jgi:serpin B
MAFPGWLEPARRTNPHDMKNPANSPRKVYLLGPTATPTPVPCRGAVSFPAVVTANNAFAFDLFASLLKSQGPGANLSFSPFSVSTALAMTWSGAQGATAAQMASMLHYTGDPASMGAQFQQLREGLYLAATGLNLNVADSLWLKVGVPFSPAYLSDMQLYYTASENSFSDTGLVAAQVNQWVSDQTQQMIQKVLQPTDVSPYEAIMLVNAVYFKGPWAAPFSPGGTQPRPFTCADGSVTSTAMMSQLGTYYYSQDRDAQVVELPYATTDYSMLVVLPAAGVSLPALEAQLSPAQLNAWVQGLCPKYAQLFLPKLDLNTGPISLIPNLQGLGMVDAFLPHVADFTGILPSGGIVIDLVKHQAVVQVDETGTKAAAVTVIGGAMVLCVATPINPPVVFNADHPFLYFIRQRSSGSILFMGQVTDPDLH